MANPKGLSPARLIHPSTPQHQKKKTRTRHTANPKINSTAHPENHRTKTDRPTTYAKQDIWPRQKERVCFHSSSVTPRFFVPSIPIFNLAPKSQKSIHPATCKIPSPSFCLSSRTQPTNFCPHSIRSVAPHIVSHPIPHQPQPFSPSQYKSPHPTPTQKHSCGALISPQNPKTQRPKSTDPHC